MKFSDKVTDRINSIEHFANNAPMRYFPFRVLAWIAIILAMLLTNLIAVARWPIVWLISLTSKREPIESSPVEIESFLDLEATLGMNEYVLVDFWAQWCGPCMLMNSALKETSESYSGRLRVAKVDASVQGKTCKRFKVRGLPTLILFRNGKEIERRSGAMTAIDISSWIDGTIKNEKPKEMKANM